MAYAPTVSSGEEPAPTISSASGFRRFLKLAAERSRIRHRLGLGGGEIASGRSHVVDQVVARACQLAAEALDLGERAALKEGCAVVALGGYGRRELFPFSDVDLLFLHDARARGPAAGFVQRVLVMLWDAGLTVGHSFRGLAESVAVAREDVPARTALSDARLVTGDRHLFADLERALDEAVFAHPRRREAFLEALFAARGARQARHGRTVCLQEPNVKESAGGLRDLHTMAWAGRLRFGARGFDALRAGGHLSDAEHARARRAYDFLGRVRNEAHFLGGRKADLLVLELQSGVAAHLGYETRRGRPGSEALMKDYYRRAQELHELCDSFLARVAVPPGPRRLRPRWGRSRRGAFEVGQGRLALADPGRPFPQTPAEAARAFEVAQQEGVRLDDRLRLAIRTRLRLVDAGFRRSPEARDTLLGILGRRGRVGEALRDMHETGFLGRLLPEFARITFLVQHDHYHRYTVDEHTLAAIEILDQVARSDDPGRARLREVLARVADATPLYLALLLHDLGKGRGGAHAARGARIAERVCARLQVGASVAADACFLVRSHLLMTEVSQRRDLSEPRVVEAFAAAVKTPQRLDMLMLLTWADASSVGPGVWTEWKAMLLWDLYSKTRGRLSGSPPSEGAEGLRSSLLGELAPEFPASVVERHLALMPERYERTLTPVRLKRHLRLVRWLAARPLAVAWRPTGNHTEMTVAAADRPGLLAAIAGTLTAAGIDILSVDVYTREDGVVLDTFLVSSLQGEQPVGPDRWRKIEADLLAAAEGRLKVAEMVEERRLRSWPRRRGRPSALPLVRLDGEASEDNTVVEVQAEDEPGLVYRITRTLAGLGLDISLGKVATERGRAFDVFYVHESEGGKLAPARAAEVEKALLAALRPLRTRTSDRPGEGF